MDTFAYQNPDMLIFVAAGNDGSYTGYDDDNGANENKWQTQSLGSPAHAKNIVSVGM